MDLANEVARLRDENTLLKAYAEKVTKEIQRYQSKGIPPVDGNFHDAAVPDVGALTPLLRAYEERLRDLEGVLDNSVSLSEQIQELVHENKVLRERLASGREPRAASEYLANQGPDNKEDFSHLYQLATEQNDVLLQQNEIMKSTLERMKEEQNAQGIQAAQDRRLTHEARTIAKNTEECAGHLQQQRDAAESKLRDVLEEFIDHKKTFEAVQREWEVKAREWRLERKSLDEFRMTYDERWKQAVADADEANKENERVVKQSQDSRLRALKNERLCHDLEEKLRQTRKELDATKAEAENMLILMEGLEKRLQDTSVLRDHANSELQAHIEQADALIAERDRNQMLEQSARDQLAKMDARAQETAEQLTRSLEDKTDGLRRNLTRKIAQLEEEIRVHGNMLTDEKLKHDAYDKQKAHENEQWSRKVKLLESENSALERSSDQSHERVLQLEEGKHTLDLEYTRLKRESAEQVQMLTNKLRGSEEQAVESLQAVGQLKKQLEEITAAYENTQRVSTSLRLRFDQLWGENQAEKNLRAEVEEHWRIKQVDEISACQKEWEHEVQRCRDAEEEAVELLRAQEDFWAQKDEEYVRGKEGLYDQIEKLKRQNMDLRLNQIAT